VKNAARGKAFKHRLDIYPLEIDIDAREIGFKGVDQLKSP